MSTITREFTKERLIEHLRTRIEHRKGLIASMHIDRGYRDYLKLELLSSEIALASLEAEPVAWMVKDADTGEKIIRFDRSCFEGSCQPLYTAPPAPVSVPDEATPENIEILASTFAPRGVTYQWDRDECNAAADSWNACRAAMLQGADGNSPVIPDGWVLVPVEPTDEMLRALYHCGTRLIRPFETQLYQDMLTAAPQQEVTQALAKGMERHGDAMQKLADSGD